MLADEPDLAHHGDLEVTPGLVDFAVNVHDAGPPPWLVARLAAALGSVGRYPDPAAARAAVAAAHGIPPESVLLTNGGAEAFGLLARLPWRSPLVVHPQFTEPEAALRAAGHRPTRHLLPVDEGFALDPTAVPLGADLVVVGNPTNPTSRLHDADVLGALADPGRLVVVDEAFLDAVEPVTQPRNSLVRRAAGGGFAVVRSLTKTYAIPGVRIGYVVASPDVVARLAAVQQPWAVGTVALAAATACLSAQGLRYAEGVRSQVPPRVRHLAAGLRACGLEVVQPAAGPFVLARHPEGEALRRGLRGAGFAVRRGDTFPGLGPTWLRFAARHEDLTDRLLAAVARTLDALEPASHHHRGVPMSLIAETIAAITPLSVPHVEEAGARQSLLTKPRGSLGVLEDLGAQLAGVYAQCPPPLPEPVAVAVFAGDHGVHARGVSPWPQEVTAQMVLNFLAGGAVVNALARQVGAQVTVVDVGVAGDLPDAAGLRSCKVARGTRDLVSGPAMSAEQVRAAVEVGIETARGLVGEGHRLLVTGDMGIANTTPSAALVSVFTGLDPHVVTGRGTGIDDPTLERKVAAVTVALARSGARAEEPMTALAEVGGLEHAAVVGFLLAAAALRTPVVLDGVIACSAALVAAALAPDAVGYWVAGHRSVEPGAGAALERLGLRPLVDLGLRLGEGSGAALAVPLVQSAARVLAEVATFDSAGVTDKE